MNKKLVLIGVLGLCMCLLTGCVGSEFFGLRSPWLESLFGEDTEEENGNQTADAQSETVTISREEYEQYRQFDEMIDLMEFADEKVKLGNDFMDKYEDPSVHRKAEAVEEAFKTRNGD